MKKIFLFFVIILCSASVFAQNKNRIEISATEYYSFGANKINDEVSLGYAFNNFGLNLNVDWLNLPEARVMGESLAFSIPSKRDGAFSINPEIGIGIAHGKFDAKESSVKVQSYIGSSLNFKIMNNISSGFVMRFMYIDSYGSMFMLGSRLALSF